MAKETAARVVTFDPAKIPAAPTTPPKHDPTLLAEFITVMESGQGAGDGVSYADAKLARSAANSIKRSLRKYAEGYSTRTRIWSSAPDAFHFALLQNTQGGVEAE